MVLVEHLSVVGLKGSKEVGVSVGLDEGVVDIREDDEMVYFFISKKYNVIKKIVQGYLNPYIELRNPNQLSYWFLKKKMVSKEENRTHSETM